MTVDFTCLISEEPNKPADTGIIVASTQAMSVVLTTAFMEDIGNIGTSFLKMLLSIKPDAGSVLSKISPDKTEGSLREDYDRFRAG